MKLSNKELMAINGGGFNIGFFLGVSSVISFIIGVVDGYLRPLKCNRWN